MNKVMQGYPVVFQSPVAWGEMDALGHVNNIIYFRYFESARMEYLRQIGLDDFIPEGIGVILHSTQCRFRVPLTYPDTVTVGACAKKIEADRFSMEYIVYSQKVKAIAAEGSGLLVMYDYNQNEKTGIPRQLLVRINQLEGKRS